jgi:hypothetical protein
MRSFKLLCGAATMTGIFGASAAYADSVNQPGFTLGFPVYADLPQGLYLALIPETGVREGNPDVTVSAVTPFFFYQSPLKIAGARIAPVFSPIYLDVKVKGGPHFNGFYNTYGGVQATWQLGGGWGAGARIGGFLKHTNEVAKPFTTFDTRFGATYFKNGTHFTANFNYGAPTGRGGRAAPDYGNLDITFSKSKGPYELGVVAFGSTDLNRPLSTYRLQSQVALGVLAGYAFKSGVSVQFRLTSDVYQRNYGGPDRRVWSTIAIPIFLTKTQPTPTPPVAAPINSQP